MYCPWLLAVPVLDLKRSVQTSLGNRWISSTLTVGLSISFSGKSSFFCCWLLPFTCSLHCCCRQPGLWSLPVHWSPETLWLAWRWGMTIFWCNTLTTTLNPGLSPLVMHIFHCPMDFTYQTPKLKKIFLVISVSDNKMLNKPGDLLIMQNLPQLQNHILQSFPVVSSSTHVIFRPST